MPYGNQYTLRKARPDDRIPATHTVVLQLRMDVAGGSWVLGWVPYPYFGPRGPMGFAGTLASTGPGMVGADTAAAAEDTVLVVVTVAAIAATLVVPHAVVSVVTAASAVATAEAMVAAIADNDLQELVGCRRVAGLQHGRGAARERSPSIRPCAAGHASAADVTSSSRAA